MAGILGVGGRPVEARRIRRMCDVLAHRGPDDAGYTVFRQQPGGRARGDVYTERRFRHINERMPVLDDVALREGMPGESCVMVLGHRRLSVIDLTEHGHQPMSTADGRYWISFNGEIYNYRELRADLEGSGWVFRTNSDTEVLLALFAVRGSKAFSLLNGMFALAIYDSHEHVLTLARDRFGIKPLYYASEGGYFVFASELKGIFASGHLRAAFDAERLVEYFTFQNLFGSGTLFRGARLLAPGEMLTVRGSPRGDVQSQRWHVDAPADYEDVSPESVAACVTRGVERQLVADVEIGSYLSGGMDSGSIVAIATRLIPRLLTFTAGFDLTNVDGLEQGFDEREAADKLAFLLQTEHYHVVLHAGDMPAVMERLTWHVDDPRVGMCHQNWYASKLASRFVKVCLSGAGGDELFGGYPWRYRAALHATSDDEFERDVFHFWHRLLPPAELPALFAPELRSLTGAAETAFHDVFAASPGTVDGRTLAGRLQRLLDFEQRTFLHGVLLIEDRVSMAHGLETRVPFLDNELATLSRTISPHGKLDVDALANRGAREHIASAEGKLILRRAMERYLPREFTEQKKKGFSPPDENWYRGPSMEFIKQILFDTRAVSRPWFDQTFIRQKLDEHFRGERNHRLLIWSLLSIEFLQRHFVDTAFGGDT